MDDLLKALQDGTPKPDDGPEKLRGQDQPKVSGQTQPAQSGQTMPRVSGQTQPERRGPQPPAAPQQSQNGQPSPMIPPAQSDAQKLDKLQRRIRELEAAQHLPDPFAAIFVASATALSGGKISWKEDCILSGNYTAFGRSGLLASGTAASPLNAGDFVSVGKRVLMLEEEDPAAKAMVYHYFSGGGSNVVRFLITTASSNNFEYNAKSVTGDATPTSLGTTSSGDKYLVQNLAEWGSSDGEGHHVTAAANKFPKYGIGVIVGQTSDDPPVPIVQAAVYFNCSD